jgi:hypothetical protein
VSRAKVLEEFERGFKVRERQAEYVQRKMLEKVEELKGAREAQSSACKGDGEELGTCRRLDVAGGRSRG